MPDKKEPQFFSSFWSKGLCWYEGLFDRSGQKTAIGEASMTYTYPEFRSVIAGRIASVLPDVKLIYVVRNPVDRAYSHYLYYRFHSGAESRDFETALVSDNIYIQTSDYMSWINTYLKRFDPEKILLVLFEEWILDQYATLSNIASFIGVNSDEFAGGTPIHTNSSYVPRSRFASSVSQRFLRSSLRRVVEGRLPHKIRPVLRNSWRAVLGKRGSIPTMREDTREYLGGVFEESVSRLEDYWERDLRAWRGL
jgi:hypothetical protein